MARKVGERIILSPQEARQGDIVLRSRWRRVIFISGLARIVVVGLVLAYAMS